MLDFSEKKEPQKKKGKGLKIIIPVGAVIILAAFVCSVIFAGFPFDIKDIVGLFGSSDEESTSSIAPTLRADVVSGTQIKLNWSCELCEQTEYKIERRAGDEVTYFLVASLGAAETSYLDADLTDGNTYCYRIVFQGASEQTLESCATLPPSAPSGLSAAVASNSVINLSWEDNSSAEDGFLLERRPGEAGDYIEVAKVGAETTQYTDEGLDENSAFCYRLLAFKSGGARSAYSSEVCANTLLNTPDAPSGLKVVFSLNGVYLSWKDNSVNEDGFYIERKIGKKGKYGQVGSVGKNVTSYENRVMGYSERDLYYRVRAYNATGESPYCPEANAISSRKSQGASAEPPSDCPQCSMPYKQCLRNCARLSSDPAARDSCIDACISDLERCVKQKCK